MFKAAPVSADALLYGIKMLQASVSTVTKGKILYQKNADELLSIASMTKMMSEYLVHEAVDKGCFNV
jgi:D-alanyl-D-alanine carboxypeptidase